MVDRLLFFLHAKISPGFNIFFFSHPDRFDTMCPIKDPLDPKRKICARRLIIVQNRDVAKNRFQNRFAENFDLFRHVVRSKYRKPNTFHFIFYSAIITKPR